jgi:spore coat protein U-like protein
MKTGSLIRIVRLGLLPALFLISVDAPNKASAATATANLTVSATIANTCTISTAALTFGAYDPIVANATSPLNGTGTITTTCTTGASPVITLGQGLHAGTGSTDPAPIRRMNTGSNYMGYALYQDSGHATVWGNTSGTSPAAVTGTGLAQNTTVYGQVSAGQDLPAGTYNDTVVATVTF